MLSRLKKCGIVSKKTPNLRKIYHFNSQIRHFFIAVHSCLSMLKIDRRKVIFLAEKMPKTVEELREICKNCIESFHIFSYIDK